MRSRARRRVGELSLGLAVIPACGGKSGRSRGCPPPSRLGMAKGASWGHRTRGISSKFPSRTGPPVFFLGPLIMTSAPSRAISMPIAFPIPLVEPVIKLTFPHNPRSIIYLQYFDLLFVSNNYRPKSCSLLANYQRYP